MAVNLVENLREFEDNLHSKFKYCTTKKGTMVQWSMEQQNNKTLLWHLTHIEAESRNNTKSTNTYAKSRYNKIQSDNENNYLKLQTWNT